MHWPATQGFAGLDPRDRAFVRLLLATTLRRLGEIEEVLGFLVERPSKGPTRPAGRYCAWAPPSSCSWARRRMLRSTPRCGWSSTPACRISKGWPTPCCAASRARAGAAGRSRPGAAEHAAMAVGELGRELRRGSDARHRRRPPDRGAARPHAALQRRLLGGPPGGRGAADRHDPPRRAAATSPSCRASPKARGGCRTPPPRFPSTCWATSQARASSIFVPRRAARRCSSPPPAPT